jgi:hypothetical protein
MLRFIIQYPEVLQQKGWVIQSLETSKLREIISFWDVNIRIAIVSQNRPTSSVLKIFFVDCLYEMLWVLLCQSHDEHMLMPLFSA